MVDVVTDANFADVVRSSETPVFVDFWAEWCPPCHRLAPILDDLAAEYAGRIQFVKMDVDHNPRTARQYGILSLPTLSVFYRGELISQTVGAQPTSRLRKLLDDALQSANVPAASHLSHG